MGRRPTGCLPTNPARGSVYVGDRAVNLSALSRVTGITKSFLSLVFSGKRGCKVKTYRLIASALGMGLEELLDALDSRKEAIEDDKVQVIDQYKSRIAREDLEDNRIRKRGRIPKPRLPGLRLDTKVS